MFSRVSRFLLLGLPEVNQSQLQKTLTGVNEPGYNLFRLVEISFTHCSHQVVGG